MAKIGRRSATISMAKSSPWGWQAVRIFGKGQLSNEAGSRRVYLGRTRSRLPGRRARREGPDYLSLNVDDSSLNALIDADLSDQVVEDAPALVMAAEERYVADFRQGGGYAPQPICGAGVASGQCVYPSANRLACAHTRAGTGRPVE